MDCKFALIRTQQSLFMPTLFTIIQWSNVAHIAQSVEHFLGKEEVTGSNPVMGSLLLYKK